MKIKNFQTLEVEHVEITAGSVMREREYDLEKVEIFK